MPITRIEDLSQAAMAQPADLLSLSQGGNSRKSSLFDLTGRLLNLSGKKHGREFAYTAPGIWFPVNLPTTQVLGFQNLSAIGTTSTSYPAPNAANMFRRTKRQRFGPSFTAGNVGLVRLNAPLPICGNGAGVGGFRLVMQGGVGTRLSGSTSFFMGLMLASSAANPSTLTNIIGMGNDLSDSNMQLICSGTSVQSKTDLGSNFPATTAETDLWRIEIISLPSELRKYYYTFTRLNTGHTVSGSVTGTAAQVPGETLSLFPMFWIYNGPGGTVAFDCGYLYLEMYPPLL